MSANLGAGYSKVSYVFLAMITIPIILLNRTGRKRIGLKKPENPKWLMWSFLLGIGICLVVYIAADLLYSNSVNNWFVYISRSYDLPPEAMEQRFTFFLIFSFVSMTFSPLGEEFMYRGLIHESFAGRFSDNQASQIDSIAFALTHLSHFGIVYDQGSWRFLPVPAILWVILMYVSSRIFFVCRANSGSIWGAVIAHAGFNVTMTYLIFYHIL